MRARNVNTMYRRRSVRPDGRIYRQARKGGGAGAGYRSRRGVAGSAMALVATVIVVAAATVGLWIAFHR